MPSAERKDRKSEERKSEEKEKAEDSPKKRDKSEEKEKEDSPKKRDQSEEKDKEESPKKRAASEKASDKGDNKEEVKDDRRNQKGAADEDRRDSRRDQKGPDHNDSREHPDRRRERERREKGEDDKPRDHGKGDERRPLSGVYGRSGTSGPSGGRRPGPYERVTGRGATGSNAIPVNGPGAGRKPTVDRAKTCPFLLRVFHRIGGHHELQAFAVRGKEPVDDELQVYTWPDVTLRELADLVKDVAPEARTHNARLSFRLIYPDKAGRNDMTEVGSVSAGRRGSDDDKSLASSKFQTGDFLDLAIYH